MTQNKQTVDAYMEAYNRLDHTAILALLTDDVEWVMFGAFHHRGKEAFDKEIENGCYHGPPVIATNRLTEENDVVVAEGTVKTKDKDGNPLSLVYCDVFEMRGGLIRKLTSFVSVDK